MSPIHSIPDTGQPYHARTISAEEDGMPELEERPVFDFSVDYDNVGKILKKDRIWDLLEGVFNSRLLICFVSSLLVAGAVGHLVTAGLPTLIAIIALSILLTVKENFNFFDGQAKMKAEISTAWRLSKRYDCNKIEFTPKRGYDYHDLGEMHVGTLPNRLSNTFIKYLKDNNISAICSVNQSMERENRFLSVPISDELIEELEDAGVAYLKLDVNDHTSPSSDQMNRGADFIYGQLANNNNVLIHCLAGKGRSNHLPAAVMIKYLGFTAREAAEAVSNSRKVSTLMKIKTGKQTKIDALQDFLENTERR